jgi:hypothetical protein
MSSNIDYDPNSHFREISDGEGNLAGDDQAMGGRGSERERGEGDEEEG